jgi:hypothetical protein
MMRSIGLPEESLEKGIYHDMHFMITKFKNREAIGDVLDEIQIYLNGLYDNITEIADRCEDITKNDADSICVCKYNYKSRRDLEYLIFDDMCLRKIKY